MERTTNNFHRQKAEVDLLSKTLLSLTRIKHDQTLRRIIVYVARQKKDRSSPLRSDPALFIQIWLWTENNK